MSPEAAWDQIYAAIRELPAFEVSATRAEVFSVTSVIYLAIGEGSRELQSLHNVLNAGALAFVEPFPYHPHITLAQDFPPAQFAQMRELAVRRWAEFRGPRSFDVENITFVQNTEENRWIDLAECSLRVPSAAGVSRTGRSVP